MGEVCELEAEEGGGEFSLGRVVGEGRVVVVGDGGGGSAVSGGRGLYDDMAGDIVWFCRK